MIRAGAFILRAYQDFDAAEMAAAVRKSSESWKVDNMGEARFQ